VTAALRKIKYVDKQYLNMRVFDQ